MYGCGKDWLILIPFGLPQIICFTLSLKCLSSDSGNCPNVGIGPLLQLPHLPTAGSVLLTLLFYALVSSSYQDLPGSIYSFPLVRYSCPLSAGVLHALLCLKVYSWCIHGEKSTPCPPTPLPSCSNYSLILYPINLWTSEGQYSSEKQMLFNRVPKKILIALTFLWHSQSST